MQNSKEEKNWINAVLSEIKMESELKSEKSSDPKTFFPLGPRVKRAEPLRWGRRRQSCKISSKAIAFDSFYLFSRCTSISTLAPSFGLSPTLSDFQSVECIMYIPNYDFDNLYFFVAKFFVKNFALFMIFLWAEKWTINFFAFWFRTISFPKF